MYVILCGNPVDGLKIYGPFEAAEIANEWAEVHLHNIGMDSWWCVDVIPTEKPAYYSVLVVDTDGSELDRQGPYNTLAEALNAQEKVSGYDTEIHKCERIK